MNTSSAVRFGAGLTAFLLTTWITSAVTFTNDARIGIDNTNYDGQAVTITNCIVTVDGAHSFAGLQVLNGGVLTHSFADNGVLTNAFAVTNEAHVLSGTNEEALIYSNAVPSSVVVRDGSGLVTYTNNVDYSVATTGNLVTIRRTETSSIADGSTVLVDYEVSDPPVGAGLNLTIGGDVLVAAGGAINANGKGYGGNLGPGNGRETGYPESGGGAGYGGSGGMSSSNALGGTTYGYYDHPTDLGSGGGAGYLGAGGAGGGAIRLTAGGTVIINGLVSANGADATNSRSGGGSGGSVWITAATLIGSGSVTANGGAGEPVVGGGGGGGRIAVVCSTDNFTGQLHAYGGLGATAGGAGTVFQSVAQHNSLVLDNGGRAGTNTPVQIVNTPDVLIRSGARATPTGSWTVDNLTIASNGMLSVASYPNPLSLNVQGNAIIQPGGVMSADGQGYPAGTGIGAGRYYSGTNTFPCGGGGYGGLGASGSHTNAFGGQAYGSPISPTMLGSGGGGAALSVGGAGGGAILLNVKNLLQVDGCISANGNSGSGLGGGGGAGGSIFISLAGTMTGSGSITANGGDGAGSDGGGGGGGRIAINPVSNLFSGMIQAVGGGGANRGGAGTVLIQTHAQPISSELILDNAGYPGTNTPVQSASSSALIVRNGAVGSVGGSLSFASLILSSNGWLTTGQPRYYVNLSCSISGDATIQAGSGIVADAAGYPPSQGPGAGHYHYDAGVYLCSGAGHGGYGANSAGNVASGGNTYDNVVSPYTPGSGGGTFPSTAGGASLGGAGGGVIQLTVNGSLNLEGTISANGGDGGGAAGGGGSGGSIQLNVGLQSGRTFSGSGSVTANGGDGVAALGGGGGGGRISIHCANSSFAGSLSAHGGGGANRGGAGTVYFQSSPASYLQAQLMLDNGGNVGTNTTFDVGSTMDLIVSGGAIAQWPGYGGTVRNLLIRTNGLLTFAPNLGGPALVTVSGDATIYPGGAISADGLGYYGSSGGGTGYSSPSVVGGGGHGGLGAADPPGYGGAYGSWSSPLLPGSAGGQAITQPPLRAGGTGGGAFRLNVQGTLTVDGRVSADGRDGDLDCGGGSGGSVWITAGTLAGSGIISANGGSGNGIGGGGGGGRIALNYDTDVFSGWTSAHGGNGNGRGGAGTIYTKANNTTVGQLWVDNGGVMGTNTPLAATIGGLPPTPFDLNISGGAVVFPQTPLPLLNTLDIGSGGVLTGLPDQSNLLVAVQGDANIAYGGAIAVDGIGFAPTNGPGAGGSLSGQGSGGGYGGVGGASASGAPGGTTYGSANQPLDFGSGGGSGSGPITGGSRGGGALRLVVAGWLNVDGSLTAHGEAGLQDDSGGGSGGSIWVSASALSGTGWISADGGSGDPYGGGGGGGGRIALYSPIDAYAGFLSAAGGTGATAGGAGTLFTSTNLTLAVAAQSPTGLVNDAVSYVDLTFNSAVDATSFSSSDATLNTPNGPVPEADLSVSMLDLSRFRVAFPQQTAVGVYTLTVGPQVQDIFGQTMSQPYTGTFTVSLPVVSGTVTDTNGQPVPGVVLQPSGGFSPTTTDTNGNYALGFVPGSSFTVTPSQAGFQFAPGTRAYTNLTASVTNENYVRVTTIAPIVIAGPQGTNLLMRWQGLSGVTYQVYCSTNLTDWLPYNDPINGSNGVQQVALPLGNDPQQYFRLQANN